VRLAKPERRQSDRPRWVGFASAGTGPSVLPSHRSAAVLGESECVAGPLLHACAVGRLSRRYAKGWKDRRHIDGGLRRNRDSLWWSLLAAPHESEEAGLLSLKAPVAGSVIELQIAAGAVLRELSVSMMTIADLETISVATNVSKREAALVVTGQPVQVRFPAYPGEDFKGETRLIGSTLDGDAPSTKVQIALQNPNMRLKLNMFAYATFFGPKETVSMVPISALVPMYALDLVFVEVEPWIFEARAVGVGILEDSQDIVASGLKVGDRVVVRGSGLLLGSQAQ
jgi:hypothetical protein